MTLSTNPSCMFRYFPGTIHTKMSRVIFPMILPSNKFHENVPNCFIAISAPKFRGLYLSMCHFCSEFWGNVGFVKLYNCRVIFFLNSEIAFRLWSQIDSHTKKQNGTLFLSLLGHGGVLPPQNSVGSSGYSLGFWDTICCPHTTVAALLCHPLHCHIWLCHHNRNRGLFYRAVRFGTLRLWETQGKNIRVCFCASFRVHVCEKDRYYKSYLKNLFVMEYVILT